MHSIKYIYFLFNFKDQILHPENYGSISQSFLFAPVKPYQNSFKYTQNDVKFNFNIFFLI